MSRIGKLPVEIPAGVEIKLEGQTLSVKGAKGVLTMELMDCVQVDIQEKEVIITRASDVKEDRAAHGMTRAILANLVKGVTEGFEKKLEINGVGYRAEGGGANLTLQLGFSHPVKMTAPEGVSVEIEKNIITVKGIDKQKVGQFAANIREWRKPEPYKGKGIRYIDEYVARKAGKKAGAK